MKWLTGLIVIVVVVFLWVMLIIEIRESVDKDEVFRKSEYERGAMFAVDWNYKYHDYPSEWARKKYYLHPELTVDSIRYLQDSMRFSFSDGVDSIYIKSDSTAIIWVSKGKKDSIITTYHRGTAGLVDSITYTVDTISTGSLRSK